MIRNLEFVLSYLELAKGKLILLFLFAIITVNACIHLPEADYYEIEGIVSIEARHVAPQNNWVVDSTTTSVLVRSVKDTLGTAGTISFSFYIRQPGSYGLWVLTKSAGDMPDPEANDFSLPFRVQDEHGFLVSIHQLRNPASKWLKWVNRDASGGENIMIPFDKPGHYTLIFESNGKAGYVIDKLHLTLNNAVKPEGMGLPGTRDPRIDPVRAKRDQPVRLPPAGVFGVIDNEKFSRIKTIQRIDKPELSFVREAFESTQQNSVPNSRGFVLAPLHALHLPEFKKYPTQWSTDAGISLKESIEMIANPRLSTYEVPFLIHRMDGVYDGREGEIPEEDFLRWIQFSAFSTVMVVPGSTGETTSARFSRFSDTFRKQFRELTGLRCRLFPYIYSLTHRVRVTGEKPVTGDGQHPTQYQFGEAFLVAPVYEQGSEQRQVWLPEGLWYDYWEGTIYRGGQNWMIEAPLETIPVMVRAGAIIPYRDRQPEQTGVCAGLKALLDRESGQTSTSDNHLKIEVYSGDRGTFRFYEDDGRTTKYLQGEFATTAFRYFEHSGYATFTIGATVGEFEGQHLDKEYSLHFKFWDEPIEIHADGESLERGAKPGQWEYDAEKREVVLRWNQPGRQKTDFRITHRL